jgi:aminoglycoside 6'-N-acetyltransferase
MQNAAPGEPGEWYQIAIEVRATGEMIGDCAFCLDEVAPGHAEIGVTLSRSHQGQGYGCEAVGRLLEYLFGELCVRKVFANCDTRNERSSHLLERLGMQITGAERSVPFKGEWCTERWYSISEGQWRSGESCIGEP